MTDAASVISNSMGNKITEWQNYDMPTNDADKKTSKKQVHRDSVSISSEAAQLRNEDISAYKKWELLMEQVSNAESLEKYKMEDLFKMELHASSFFGKDNIFQNYSKCQYEVFHKWLEENVDNLSKETVLSIQNEIKNATSTMDKLNGIGGYRGTSFESVALLESSRFALENIKNAIVPEKWRSDFQQLIDEYVLFNEEPRDRIMEKMTPDYIVEDIGKSTQYYRYKDDLLSGTHNFYKRRYVKRVLY